MVDQSKISKMFEGYITYTVTISSLNLPLIFAEKSTGTPVSVISVVFHWRLSEEIFTVYLFGSMFRDSADFFQRSYGSLVLGKMLLSDNNLKKVKLYERYRVAFCVSYSSNRKCTDWKSISKRYWLWLYVYLYIHNPNMNKINMFQKVIMSCLVVVKQ